MSEFGEAKTDSEQGVNTNWQSLTEIKPPFEGETKDAEDNEGENANVEMGDANIEGDDENIKEDAAGSENDDENTPDDDEDDPETMNEYEIQDCLEIIGDWDKLIDEKRDMIRQMDELIGRAKQMGIPDEKLEDIRLPAEKRKELDNSWYEYKKAHEDALATVSEKKARSEIRNKMDILRPKYHDTYQEYFDEITTFKYKFDKLLSSYKH